MIHIGFGIGLVHSYMGAGGAVDEGACDVYHFQDTTPDYLSFGTPLAGNVKTIFAATSMQGVHPDIAAGLLDTFVPSTDPVDEPNWNYIESEVGGVYTFENSHIDVAIDIVIGDELTFTFLAPAAINDNQVWIDAAVGTPRLFVLNSGDKINYVAADMDVYLDDVKLLGNNNATCPTDELEHEFKIVALTNFTFTVVGDSYTGSAPLKMAMYDLKLNDGAVHNYPMRDGWLVNPTIKNFGSGADGVMVNGMESGWGDGLTYLVDATFNGVLKYAKNDVWYTIDTGRLSSYLQSVYNTTELYTTTEVYR